MRICGLLKLTLLDFPDHLACTIFTGGCQFKCPFCQNSSLVFLKDDSKLINEDEIFDFLNKRKGILDGVCITGGEPTIQKDLIPFIKKIKSLGFKVKLDTNGYLPDVVKKLVEEKLVDYVAMDVKNSLAKYKETAGLLALRTEAIKESINFLKSGIVEHEFRTTVVKEFHDNNDFEEIGKLLRGEKRYFLQQFEDSESCIQKGLHAHSKETLEGFVEILKKYDVNASLRGID